MLFSMNSDNGKKNTKPKIVVIVIAVILVAGFIFGSVGSLNSATRVEQNNDVNSSSDTSKELPQLLRE